MSGWPLQGNPLLAAAEHGASVGDRMLRLHYLTAHWIGPGQAADGCSCGQAGCPAPTEHPIKPDWFQAATADLWMVRARWLHHPRANLAVVTGERFDVRVLVEAAWRLQAHGRLLAAGQRVRWALVGLVGDQEVG